MLSAKVYKDYWQYVISGYSGTNDTALSTYNAYLMTANDIQIGSPVSFNITQIVQNEINILFIPDTYFLVFNAAGDAAKIVIKQDTINFGEIDAFLINFGENVNFDGSLTVDFEYFGFLIVQNENSTWDATEAIENIRISLINKGVNITESTPLESWPKEIDKVQFGGGIYIDGQNGVSGFGDTQNIQPGDAVIRVRELTPDSFVRDTTYDYMKIVYDDNLYDLQRAVVHRYEHTGIFFIGAQNYNYYTYDDIDHLHFFTKNGNEFIPTTNQAEMQKIKWVSPSVTYGVGYSYYYDVLNDKSYGFLGVMELNNGVPLGAVYLPPILEDDEYLYDFVSVSDDGNTVAYLCYTWVDTPINSSYYYYYIKVFQRINGVFVKTDEIHSPLWDPSIDHFEMDATGTRILFQSMGSRTDAYSDYVSPIYFVTLSDGVVTNFQESPIVWDDVYNEEYYQDIREKFKFGINNQFVWLTSYSYHQEDYFNDDGTQEIEVFQLSSGNFNINSMTPISIGPTLISPSHSLSNYFTTDGNHLVLKYEDWDTYEFKIYKKTDVGYQLLDGDVIKIKQNADYATISNLVDNNTFYYVCDKFVGDIKVTPQNEIQYVSKIDTDSIGSIYSIKISRDGKFKILRSWSGSISYSHIGEDLLRPIELTSFVDALSPDSKKYAVKQTSTSRERFVVNILDGTNRLISGGDYTILNDPTRWKDIPMELQFSPDGRYLYVFGLYAIYIYYIDELNKTLQYIPNDFRCEAINSYTPLPCAVSPRYDEAVSRSIYSGVGQVQFFKITNRETFSLDSYMTLNSRPTKFTYSPNGEYLFIHEDTIWNIFHRDNGSWSSVNTVSLPPATYLSCYTFSFDSKYLFFGLGENPGSDGTDFLVVSLSGNTATVESSHKLTESGYINFIEFDPKTYDLYTGNSNEFKIYKTNNNIVIKRLYPGDILPVGVIDLGYAVTVGTYPDTSIRMMSVAREENLYPTESEMVI